MSSRNLTERSPHVDSNAPSNSSSDLADPFNNSYAQSYEGSSLNSPDDFQPPENRQRLLNYSSSVNSSNSAANPFASANNLPLPAASRTGTTDSIPTPTQQFPQGLPSRMVSMNSLGTKSTGTRSSSQNSPYSSDSSDSEKSVNPFEADTDFSPFGGYPTSSFPLHIDEKEDDDYMHNPDPVADAEYENNRFWYDIKAMDKRGAFGMFGLVTFAVGIVSIMIVMPVLLFAGVTGSGPYVPETHQLLTQYHYPKLAAIRTSLVDPDTPQSARTRRAMDGSDWQLVFSDEFAAEGRTFYEGDDQFFYAPDFHYQSTSDLEWYDPDAASTANGTLNLRMDAFHNHNLFYRSGMLHSWNQLCFTQGALEISARLPNYGNVTGLWPGLWAMGNLGRPGYMATTDGVWPYSYEDCDAGITPNQSQPDGISYLPGQRLNSCTCSGEDHPNRGVGRGAPEIDIIEGAVDTTLKDGTASQSIQLAPFDIWYMPDYNWIQIHNRSITSMNTYAGGPFQQAVSCSTTMNTNWYERGDTEHQWQKYAFEYLNDDDTGYCTWYIGSNPTWTAHSYAFGPNGNVGWRRIAKEPMSIVVNLGISNSWAYIDWPSLHFPATMRLDSIRIYQPNDSVNLGCDPPDYPTYDYIQAHPRAYLNSNNTSWGHGRSGAGYPQPKNRLMDGC